MKNVLFVSLGCDKNLVDSEKMLGLLNEAGYRVAQEESEADAIVVNTCCFIHDAKEESIETILEMAEWKKKGDLRALIVTGCMAQRYQDEIHGFLISQADKVVDLIFTKYLKADISVSATDKTSSKKCIGNQRIIRS